jgi:hypothetical protein
VPTIAGFIFAVDSPGVDGAVRIFVNPKAEEYTGGPPGLMTVSVGLDVPPEKTVRWALDIGAVSTSIRLDKMPDPQSQPERRQKSAELLEEPGTYDLGPPINRVRNYVLQGEIQGPSSAFSELSSNHFEQAIYIDTSITSLAWSGPLPAVFKGAYVRVSMPSLVSPEILTTSAYGWNPVPLRMFHGVEELSVPDYQVNTGSQVSDGLYSWTWSADGSLGIYNANGTGSSLIKQAETQRDLFVSGILGGLTATALFAFLQNLVDAVAEGRP